MSDRQARDRQAAADVALDQSAPAGRDCAAALLVQTTTVSSYPTVAAAYYAANPTQLAGPEIEGQPATPVVDTATVIYFANQGSQVPPVGTYVVVHGAAGRWVVSYNG